MTDPQIVDARVPAPASAGVTVTVSRGTVSLTNGQSQQFSATVLNSANTGVTWSISPQSGTIGAGGLYTAPGVIVGNPKVTVTATSVADATRSGTATVTLSNLVDIGVGAPIDVRTCKEIRPNLIHERSFVATELRHCRAHG